MESPPAMNSFAPQANIGPAIGGERHSSATPRHRRHRDRRAAEHRAAPTPPIVHSTTALRKTRALLQRVQEDYLSHARLSRDYREKHADMRRIYMYLSKLMVLWTQSMQRDGTMQAELMRIVDGANILSNREVDIYKRTDRHIMQEVRAATAQIDKEFFASTNPLFRDLTEDQRRTLLADREQRDALYRARMASTHNALGRRDAKDVMARFTKAQRQRYEDIFASEYFGDSGESVTLAQTWDSGVFAAFFGGDVSRTISFDVSVIPEVDPDAGEPGQMSLYAWMARSKHAMIAQPCRYLREAAGTFDPASIPHLASAQIQLREWLHAHPLFRHEPDIPEMEVVGVWRDRVEELFVGVWDLMYMYERQNTHATPPSTEATETGVSVVALLEQVDPSAVVAFSSDDDGVVVESSPDYTDGSSTLHTHSAYPPQLLLTLSGVGNDLRDYALANVYTSVAGNASTRLDALAHAVWAVCLEDGQCYPVLPTLHFMSGLHLSMVDTRDLSVYWCDVAVLMAHLTSVQSQLDPRGDRVRVLRNDPVLRQLHYAGTNEERLRAVLSDVPFPDDAEADDAKANEDLNPDEAPSDAHLYWRECLERDTRVFVDTLDMRRSAEHDTQSSHASTDDGTRAMRWATTLHGDRPHVAVPAYIQQLLDNDGGEGGSEVDADRLVAYAKILFVCVKEKQASLPADLEGCTDAYYNFDDTSVVNVDAFEKLAGPLHYALGALYLSLGRMRVCPFRQPNREPSSMEIQREYVHALHVQMLLTGLTSRYCTDVATRRTMRKSYDEYASAGNVSWTAFRNVFTVGLLHPWLRDAAGMACARDLTQVLQWDLLEALTTNAMRQMSGGGRRVGGMLHTQAGTPGVAAAPAARLTSTRHTPAIGPRPNATTLPTAYLIDLFVLLQRAAYPTDDKENSLAPSVFHVHLLRLLLWNVGIWEIDVDVREATLARFVVKHLQQLYGDPYHPFAERLRVEDIAHGHPSPLVLAQLFAVCARFLRFNDDQRAEPKREAAFREVFDDAVTRVTHPVFSAMLLKLRAAFFANPSERLLYMLWYPIDIARWSNASQLNTHLIEYGTARAVAMSPYLYPERVFLREYDRVMSVAMRVAELPPDEVREVQREVDGFHMGQLMPDA